MHEKVSSGSGTLSLENMKPILMRIPGNGARVPNHGVATPVPACAALAAQRGKCCAERI
jgi:hypothetical protein